MNEINTPTQDFESLTKAEEASLNKAEEVAMYAACEGLSKVEAFFQTTFLPAVSRQSFSGGMNLVVGYARMKFRPERGGHGVVMKASTRDPLDAFAAFTGMAPTNTVQGSKYLIAFFPGEACALVEKFSVALMGGAVVLPEPAKPV